MLKSGRRARTSDDGIKTNDIAMVAARSESPHPVKDTDVDVSLQQQKGGDTLDTFAQQDSANSLSSCFLMSRKGGLPEFIP